MIKNKISEKTDRTKKSQRTQKAKNARKVKTENVASQKRFVSAVKVFLNDAEKEEILARVGNFKSISNYIRHHLGLTPNGVGRKRRYTESALDLETNDFEKPTSRVKVPKHSKAESKAGCEKEIKIGNGQLGLWDNFS